jgi:hypothetical protein
MAIFYKRTYEWAQQTPVRTNQNDRIKTGFSAAKNVYNKTPYFCLVCFMFADAHASQSFD